MCFLSLGRASMVLVLVPVWVRGQVRVRGPLALQVQVWERRWGGIIPGSHAACSDEPRCR